MIRELLHKIGFHWWIETGKWTRKCRICGRKEVFIAGIGAADWVKDDFRDRFVEVKSGES